jgi:tRNA A-37 threonylcarbamoyl transferase component Bud32
MKQNKTDILQPGDILLDKYRIETLLGQGAFAEVYRVTHLDLQVQRALKVLRHEAPGVGSTDFNNFTARFKFEAQIGAKLNTPTPHPNLLQVHDFKATGKQLVLEMEYAAGGSLKDRMVESKESGKAIPIEDVLKIAVDVAEGLGAIHAYDIIHRDLKPSNILFDNKGNAKVADLGLAQVPGGPSLRDELSTPRPHPGTPGYMSPEQENSLGVLRPPSDIYALGLVVFEMLTGRNYTYAEPGTRASALRLAIPKWLDDLLASMLAKEPNARPWDGKKTAILLRAGLQKEEEPARQAGLEKGTREKAEHKSGKKRPLRVYLCYADNDKETVGNLYARLAKDGLNAWLDKAKLLPGQDWEFEIRKAVREADVVVVCLSKPFNQAGFQQKEVRLALDTAMEKPEGEIFIIPARLEECDTLESLRKWHWVDLFEDDGYEMLMRALRARADKIEATIEKPTRKKVKDDSTSKPLQEKADREAAEKVAREKAEREASEKAVREKVRLEAEELARQKAAKEKVEREATEKARREADEHTHKVPKEKNKKQNDSVSSNFSLSIGVFSVFASVLSSALFFQSSPSLLIFLCVFYIILEVVGIYLGVVGMRNSIRKSKAFAGIMFSVVSIYFCIVIIAITGNG